MTPAAVRPHPFDALADHYDSLFTDSVIGRAQRNAVWAVAQHVFSRGDHILELGCGSGEDALFLARAGMSLLACDISRRMIAVAAARARAELPEGLVEFCVLANERLGELPQDAAFTGAFSNFSSLNCVADLKSVARQLSARLPARASALLCLSSRVCAWEIVCYLLRHQARKAFRRFGPGPRIAHIGKEQICVWYPSLREIRRAFTPWFELQGRWAIGLLVPPSYVEPWASRRPRWLRAVARIDDWLRGWPVLRDCGDHVLLHFRRTDV
jgi:ubiquinone/menaquinone biosynthesis C-methylase UbiE